LVDLLRVQGVLRSRQGRWEEAEQSFGEAVPLARSMPYPYAEARALYEWGVMLRQAGEPERARARLEEGLAIFRRLGARSYAERTERELAGLGEDEHPQHLSFDRESPQSPAQYSDQG
jgi:tetratricopeptide (TPR) repeat protein